MKMTTLNTSIKEYLSKAEIQELNTNYPNNNSKSDNMSLDEKSKVITDFINSDFMNIYFKAITGDLYNIYTNFITHLGSGTQGIIFSLMFKNLDFLSDLPQIYNIKKNDISSINNKIACKIQLINNPEEKYWESRMLREEYIMTKLNTYETIKEFIPKFYCGFTVKFNQNKFRITLMELIDPTHFSNLQDVLDKISSEQANNIIKETKKLIHILWKNGVSHNDISIRNILIDRWDFSNIKLIDFGLSTIFNHKFNNNSKLEEEYDLYFSNKSKEEQLGSNVRKIKELIDILHSASSYKK